MNYCDFLFSTSSPKEAIVDIESGKRFSYTELQCLVKKLACFLTESGYKPGDVLSLHLYNSAEAAIVLLAIQYIGGIACLIDPLFKQAELQYYLEDSHTSFFVTHIPKESWDSLGAEKARILTLGEIQNILYHSDAHSACLPMYSYAENEIAMLLYTSGSTSMPKAVMLSCGCFYAYLKKSDAAKYIYCKEDKALCFVPFSHAYGCIAIFFPVMAYQASIVFLRSFHPIKVANAIEQETITHLFGVPTHYQQLLKYEEIHPALRKLKAAFCAAAPLNYDTVYGWHKKIGIYLDEGYGITEATTLIASRMSSLPQFPGHIGYPPKGLLEIQIVDENRQAIAPGNIGELRVKGAGIMLGYWKKEAQTAEKIQNGWLYTGDLGYQCTDGSFVLCGRKTDFINVAGLKISPLEIESALNSHPYVLDSAAIGLKDDLYGEAIHAFVVLKNTYSISERDLIRYLSHKLASFKIPKSIRFLSEFPRNPLGKIDKKKLI